MRTPGKTRQCQLIEATIDVLAAKGFAALTIADVARAAGMSHGIVIFHFGSKEELLRETLRYLLVDYDNRCREAMQAAGDDPWRALQALVALDFSLSDRLLAAWSALRAEATSRPLFLQECKIYEDSYMSMMQGACAALGKSGSVLAVATALGSVVDGLCLRLLLGQITREEAHKVASVTLSAFFRIS